MFKPKEKVLRHIFSFMYISIKVQYVQETRSHPPGEALDARVEVRDAAGRMGCDDGNRVRGRHEARMVTENHVAILCISSAVRCTEKAFHT